MFTQGRSLTQAAMKKICPDRVHYDSLMLIDYLKVIAERDGSDLQDIALFCNLHKHAQFCLWKYYCEKGLYNDAFKWFAVAFKNNTEQFPIDSKSRYELWVENRYATGAELNLAIFWCFMAAREGHAQALNDLAFCYHTGTGVAKNIKAAIFFYKQSADKGYKLANANLEACYDLLKEKPKTESFLRTISFDKLLSIFEDPEKGIGYTYELYLRYRDGVRGAPKDPGKAIELCEIIIKYYYERIRRGHMAAIRLNEFINKMSLEELKATHTLDERIPYEIYMRVQQADEKEATYWKDKSKRYFETAELEKTVVKLKYRAEFKPHAVDEQVVLSITSPAVYVGYVNKLAKNGDPHAQFFMYQAHQFGYGMVRSPVNAVQWLKKSAANGCELAQFELGYYHKQRGEDELANHWFARAKNESTESLSLDPAVKSRDDDSKSHITRGYSLVGCRAE